MGYFYLRIKFQNFLGGGGGWHAPTSKDWVFGARCLAALKNFQLLLFSFQLLLFIFLKPLHSVEYIRVSPVRIPAGSVIRNVVTNGF